MPAASSSALPILPAFPVRRRQIAINGSLGSGKTTVGRMLSEKLGWDYHSTGSVQRNIAQAMGLSTLELNHIAEKDRSIDERIDSIFKSLAAQDDVIVDSRMAWHFLPESFRVRLIVSPEEAADRVLRDTARDAEKYSSSLVAIRDIEARTLSEKRRFQNTYGVDVTDLANYDLVIDTEFLPPETVVALVVASFVYWLNRLPYARVLISPLTALPSRAIEMVDVTQVSAEARHIGAGASDRVPQVLHHRGRHIILDRHEAMLAAVAARVPVVAVAFAGLDAAAAEQTIAGLKIADLQAWEKASQRRFACYPDWITG
jgi:predicted cytidylate kinase